MPHVIASRKEAGYWTDSGWCFDLASASRLASAQDAAQFLAVNPEAEVWSLERAQEFGDFDPRYEGLYTLQPDDEVFWTDPDNGLSSGVCRVVRIVSETGAVEALHGETIIVLDCGDGLAEVFLSEVISASETIAAD